MILDEIIAHKRQEVHQQKSRLPLDKMIPELTLSKNDFKEALLQGRGIKLIAEVKRKSPSRGVINKNISIDRIIDIYDKNPNVKAISFLTDKKYFGGNLEELKNIHQRTNKPILRKDFIIDEYQVYQARYYGADAILLIASLLSGQQIQKYIELAGKYDMDCLVEVHNEKDIDKIPDNAEIIGINNRNLDTLEIALETTKRLSGLIKNKAAVIVTESGILHAADVRQMRKYADAMLIGSAIMASDSPSSRIDGLLRPRIKICGMTNLSDAKMCAENGADFLGFIFYEKTARYIAPEKAEIIIKKLKTGYPDIKTVGVFVNSNPEEVKSIKEKCRLDYLQLHGDETPEYINHLEGKVIKAFRVGKDSRIVPEIDKYETDYILLDTLHDHKYGGTGSSFDWELLNKLSKKKVFLAGGINPENYSRAISFQPYAVDLNSGVEKRPGVKDEKLVKNILHRE